MHGACCEERRWSEDLDHEELGPGRALLIGIWVVSVLAVGAGLLNSANADPELADRIEGVCLRKIESLLGSPLPS